MNAFDVFERLRHAHAARHHGDVGDEGDVAHQSIAVTPWIAPEDLQLALKGSEAEDRVKGSALAGAVRTDDAEDAPFFDVEIDAVERDGCAERFAEAVGFYADHVNAPSFFSRLTALPA